MLKSKQTGTSTVTVPTTTLDVELGNTTDVFFLKLDLQGAEPRALRGASALLRSGRVKRVLMEVDSAQRWRLNIRNRTTIDETLREVRAIFGGWRCESVCDGTPYTFPTHFVWGGKRECSNVYCVAPGVAAV